MTKQLIFLTTEGSSVLRDALTDLFTDNRAKTYEIFPDIKNPILKVLRKVHCSAKINSITTFPLREKWHNALDDIDWKKDIEYHIVFISHAFVKLPISVWHNLKCKYNIKYSLCMYNAISSFVSKQLKLKDAIYKFNSEIGFENILTTHSGDAQKYGYVFFDCFYSMTEKNSQEDIENDLYLINNAKGRLKKFYEVYEYVRQRNIKSNFRIVGVKKRDQIYPNEIIYNKRLEYKETLKEIKKSNCLLEVLGQGQTSLSMHYCEAVCYNKKLLTDNKAVVNLPYYNPEYIKVFEKPEDIDCGWIKERIPVDYGYDGSFSPSRLIDKIIKLEEQKEG